MITLTKQQEKWLLWGGGIVLAYVLLRPYFTLNTSSPKSLKMELACSENEKVINGKCVAVTPPQESTNFEQVDIAL